ncbi:MAG: glycerophosphodiester phosphodiesterase [Chloroflexota bacterium]
MGCCRRPRLGQVRGTLALVVDFRIIAHRGASGTRPENTMAAFRRAVELGAGGVELDVHLSSDGELVVIHDDTVDRTTNGHGAVAEKTAAELGALDAGQGEHVPRLAEVLALPIALNVEMKGPRLEANLAAALNDRPEVLVSSFDHDALERLRKLDPNRPLAFLSSADDWQAAIVRASAAHAFSANLPKEAVTPEVVKQIHQAGLNLLVYTVDDASLGQRLLDWGCDGLFTNYPERFLGPERFRGPEAGTARAEAPGAQ